MTTSAATSMSQRDARAAGLIEQGRKQKAELDRMVKSSFAHGASSSTSSSTSRAGRMHPRDSSAKLLDAETDFARKNLRNTWLNLLFTCTFTREAHSVDGYIWNDTSYSLITAYRSYIAAAQRSIDPTVQAPGRRGKSAQDAARVKSEYRKFLLEEELFWQELVGRLVRLFSLDEARSNLEVLGIDADNDGDTSVSSSPPADSYASRATRQANEPDETLSQAALLPAKRLHLITLLHKFLIFCGDLARYREISSHDHESSASRNNKGARRQPKYDFSRASAFYEQSRLLLPDQGNPSNQLAVVSTYKGDTFASLYHYYRALCVKTPFNKAKLNLDRILAKSTSTYLQEAADSADGGDLTWDATRDRQARDPQLVARLSANVEEAQRLTDTWLNRVIVLHGLFYKRSHLDHMMYLSSSVLATFSTLVRARALRADQIVQFLVTALCASWTTRLFKSAPSSSRRESPRPSSGGSEDRHRPQPIRSERSSKKRSSSPETGQCVEFQVMAHVLGVFRELAKVGTDETREAFDGNKELSAALNEAEGQLSPIRNLTAVVRRVLPALRIVTKWTKTHLEYMQRIEKRARDAMHSRGGSDPVVVRSEMEVRPDSERPNLYQIAYADTLDAMDRCWSQYVDLINSLRYAFPFDSLPNIGKVGAVGAPALCLEEDSDMRGFAPTRKATQSTIPGGTTISVGMGEACANIEAVRPSQMHPNEEQLMRIADLMIDAKVIAESDASPIHFNDTNNVFVYERREQGSREGRSRAAGVSAANNRTATIERQSLREMARSSSMDDPVEAAMRAAMGQFGGTPDGGGDDVDSMEESMRSVNVQDTGAGTKTAADQLLIPSQVRSKAYKNKDELARQLFAAYPLASQPQQGIGASYMTPSSSSSSNSAHGSANPQDALLQMLSQQAGTGGGLNHHYTNPVLSNGAPISSIWAPNASDMNASASNLQSYGAASDLYQRQLQQQQLAGAYQHSWPNNAYAQHRPGAFAEAYGNTTPDPFNPHGYGVQPNQQFQHQQSAYHLQNQRTTPQPGNVHESMLGYGGVPQDPYYPGPAGAGASHSPRFP